MKTLQLAVIHNGQSYEKGIEFDPKNKDHKDIARYFSDGWEVKVDTKTKKVDLNDDDDDDSDGENDGDDDTNNDEENGEDDQKDDKTKKEMLTEIEESGLVTKEELEEYKKMRKEDLLAVHTEIFG